MEQDSHSASHLSLQDWSRIDTVLRLTHAPLYLCPSQAHRRTKGPNDPCRHSFQETGASVLRKELLVDLENFLDPQVDYDFMRGSDSSQCSRGGEPYSRPWGWYRVALKVKNKYRDGNTWLGSDGWRSRSSTGEWPVSFHGTSIEGAKAITSSHYRAGPGQLYGRGIYSTPDILEADFYAMFKTFKSNKTGKTYKVIMQNQINPKKRVITAKKNYWLIPVPEEKSIVEQSICPYGILIKEVPILF
ncbi:hypothetical protein MHYP_G00356220 [Metynnis hypsauchen]